MHVRGVCFSLSSDIIKKFLGCEAFNASSIVLPLKEVLVSELINGIVSFWPKSGASPTWAHILYVIRTGNYVDVGTFVGTSCFVM